jgi:SAM-dependent methyltransferase
VTTIAATPRKKLSTYHVLVAIKRRMPAWLLHRLDPYNSEADRFVAKWAAELEPDTVVLDAGAGECRHATLFEHARYLGTDNGHGDRARWDYSHLTFFSDLENLPVPDRSVGAVLNINVLEHVSDPLRVLSECHRVLRPGGRLFLVAPQSWLMHQAPHDYYRFTRHGLEYLLRKAGFTSLTVDPVGGTFWNLGSRTLYILTHFEGWRFPLAVLLAPIFGFLIPFACYYLDKLDLRHWDTLGYKVIAHRPPE